MRSLGVLSKGEAACQELGTPLSATGDTVYTMQFLFACLWRCL